MLIRHSKYSAILSKIHSVQTAILPTGKGSQTKWQPSPNCYCWENWWSKKIWRKFYFSSSERENPFAGTL